MASHVTNGARMPQSLAQLYAYAHLIFSSKNRQPFLDDEIRPRVHAYLATIVRDLDSPYFLVGGVANHVHNLFDMGKMRAPVKFVENVKRESSKFIKNARSEVSELLLATWLRNVFRESNA